MTQKDKLNLIEQIIYVENTEVLELNQEERELLVVCINCFIEKQNDKKAIGDLYLDTTEAKNLKRRIICQYETNNQ